MSTKGERTRASIIEQATALFFKNGFESVTFAEIAKAVGISQPALYAYFDDKMDIMNACCLSAASHGRDFIDSNVIPTDLAQKRLLAYIRANLEWFVEAPKVSYLIFALYFFSVSDKKMKSLFDATREAAVSRLEALLIQGNNENAWRIADTRNVADTLHSLLIGEIYKSFHDRDAKGFRLGTKLKKFLSFVEANSSL